MTPKILASAACAALLAIFLTGCSWITDFAISNTTDSDLLISYRARTCPDGNFITIPARKSNSALKDEQKPWKDLTTTEYSCDRTTGLVRTLLPPGMALRVARIATYIGPEHYGNEDFEVFRLELSGAEGEIKLDGLKVLKAFKPESKVLYALIY